MTGRVLIATHHLNTWSGSEVVAIELAEALIGRGFEVALYAPFSRPDFTAEALPDAAALLTRPQEVVLFAWDLVYCQHQTLSRLLHRQPLSRFAAGPRPFFVYNHLSPFEPFELPGPFCERDVADLVMANSPETATRLKDYGPEFAAVRVMPNPAPDAFGLAPRAGREEGPLRILSVSNHLPDDLAATFELLRAGGAEVTRLGAPEAVRRITPGDLAAHDAVVTIGKTVQYALRARCPVFCYDSFAGPGWLDAGNFDAARTVNFSGRDTPGGRDPERLASEIREGLEGARAFADGLGEDDLAPFRLEAHVDALLGEFETHRAAPKPLRVHRDGVRPVEELRRRWVQEAELYGLVDREYGQALQARVGHAQMRALVRSEAEALQGRMAALAERMA